MYKKLKLNRIERIEQLIVQYEGKLLPCFTNEEFLKKLNNIINDKNRPNN
jgi:hypothetical protein